MRKLKLFYYYLIVCVIGFINPIKIFAQSDSIYKDQVTQWINSNNGHFEENKGQFKDEKQKTLNNVLYKINLNNVTVYVTNWGLSYFFSKNTNEEGGNSNEFIKKIKFNSNENTLIEYQRVDMVLVNANIKQSNIVTDSPTESYTNYYNSSNNFLNVKSFDKIIIKEIYPGIDWVITYKDNGDDQKGIKQDFIVHSGSDPNKIIMSYLGASRIENEHQTLKIITDKGVITENKAIAYCNNKSVPISFNNLINDNQFSFSIEGEYDNTKDLIIDPFTLTWGTLYSGNGADRSSDIAFDGTYVWVTGYTNSTNFPVYDPGTSPYYQGTIAGNYDIFILKFDKNGVRQWATYYGGTQRDVAYSISTDGSSIFLGGETSSGNIPLYNAGYYYDNSISGYTDIILAKFSSAGVLNWATLYGGDEYDCAMSVDVNNSKLLVTGYTNSTNFSTSNPGGGAYYQSSKNTDYDAFVLSFNTNSSLNWATYYGANGFDIGMGIDYDGTNTFITMNTQSTNFSLVNPGGAYQQNCPSGDNIFIVKFNSAYTVNWATYYGGSSFEAPYDLYDDGTNIWITGSTQSSNFPLYNPGGSAYYQSSLSGTSDAFIIKFNTSGVRSWGTYYGGSGTETGTCILSLGSNLWVTGITGSNNFPVYDPGTGVYYDDTFGGGSPTSSDGFILQFNTSGQRQWATYYGGSDTESGYVSICGTTNAIWISGASESSDLALQNPGGGAYYNSTFGSYSDTYLLKFCEGLNSYSVTGGITCCDPIEIGLDGSQTSVSYQLYKTTTTTVAVGSPVNGTGSAISFGSYGAWGSYTVVATSTYSGCTQTMSGNAVVSWQGCCNKLVGLENETSETKVTFNVYPNPTNGKLIIESSEKGKIVLLNTLGEIVKEINITNVVNELNIDALSEGIYLMRCIDFNNEKSIPILKIN